MLIDHRTAQERWTRGIRERKRLARAFGTFIANLAAWDWFINPLTFRDEHSSEHPSKRGELWRLGRFAVCKPDPRLFSYHPSSRYSPAPRPPVPDVALDRIHHWLADVQREASKPIRWMIAEE